MYDEENLELLLLGYIVSDDDLWQPGERQVQSEDLDEPPKEKRCWKRPWVGRRDHEESNTMYKLQLEISEVGFSTSYENVASDD